MTSIVMIIMTVGIASVIVVAVTSMVMLVAAPVYFSVHGAALESQFFCRSQSPPAHTCKGATSRCKPTVCRQDMQVRSCAQAKKWANDF